MLIADQHKLWRGPTEEAQRKKVDLVNMIIEESFGPRFKGDYHLKAKSIDQDIGYKVERGNSLKMIVEENPMWKRILRMGKIKGYAGVLNEDGSEITVIPKFSDETKRYAEVCINTPEFNKEVTVNIASIEKVHDMIYRNDGPF